MNREDAKTATMQTPEQVLAKVSQLVHEHACVSEGRIGPTDNLVAEHNFDSLDMVDLSIDIEDEWSITIPDEEWESCETIQQVATLVTRKLLGAEAVA